MKNIDPDLDISPSTQWSGKFLDTKNPEVQKITHEWSILQEKLKNIYFFTEQQLNDVFNKNSEPDILLFDQIINDVEKVYQKIPWEISINEYLYETLMHIEDKSSASLDEAKYRDVLNTIDTYVGKDAQMIQYNYFGNSSLWDDDAIHENIKTYIQNSVKDFFLIHIDEDRFLSDEDKNHLPGTIKNLLRYSEHRWINLYAFVQKDWKIKVAAWVFGWSTGRGNDTYFGDVVKELSAKKIDIALSSLVLTK